MERTNFLDRRIWELAVQMQIIAVCLCSCCGCSGAVPVPRHQNLGTGMGCEQGQSSSFPYHVQRAVPSAWLNDFWEPEEVLVHPPTPYCGDIPYQPHCPWVHILVVLLSTHCARAGTCVGLSQCKGKGRIDPWALLAQRTWCGGLALTQHHQPQTCKAMSQYATAMLPHRGKTDPILNWAWNYLLLV